MNDLFTKLNQTEIESLDQFLLDRISDDDDTEGKDEGVLDISELGGLFTAIVSGPVMILPSQWLSSVWGDFEPEWKNEKKFETVFTLLMRYMNSIAEILMEHAEGFEPIFLERGIEGKSYAIVNEWCEGYRRGMLLAPDRWDAGGQEMTILLTPILAFTSETDWRGHDYSLDEVENTQNAIAPNVRDIHAFWLSQREEESPSSRPVRRTEPRIGRNDPC